MYANATVIKSHASSNNNRYMNLPPIRLWSNKSAFGTPTVIQNIQYPLLSAVRINIFGKDNICPEPELT